VRCPATDAKPSAHVSPTVTCFDRVAHEENEPPIGLVSEVCFMATASAERASELGWTRGASAETWRQDAVRPAIYQDFLTITEKKDGRQDAPTLPSPASGGGILKARVCRRGREERRGSVDVARSDDQ